MVDLRYIRKQIKWIIEQIQCIKSGECVCATETAETDLEFDSETGILQSTHTDGSINQTTIEVDNEPFILSDTDSPQGDNGHNVIQADANQISVYEEQLQFLLSGGIATLSLTDSFLNSLPEESPFDLSPNFGIIKRGRDESLFGTSGFNSYDFSTSYGASTTHGATGSQSVNFGEDSVASGYGAFAGTGFLNDVTGTYSVGFGYDNTVGGYASFAHGIENTNNTIYSGTMGSNNVLNSGGYNFGFGIGLLVRSTGTTVVGQANNDYTPTGGSINIGTSPMFIVGNGNILVGNPNTPGTRSDAFIVRKNGELTAPSLTTALIDAEASGRVLITKEWFNAQSSGGGGAFEFLTEGANTGIRRTGANPSQFGNIGADATDLSFSTGNSGTRGATGLRSVAIGTDVISSGTESLVFGTNGTSSGTESIMIGRGSSTGFQSVAIGTQGAQATAGWSLAMGANAIASGSNSLAIGTHLNSPSTISSGRGSVAIGAEITAAAQYEVSLGRYGTLYTANNPNGYNNLDRAFNVGIGDNTIGSGVKGRTDGITMLWRGDVGLGINNFEANTTGERLQVNGKTKTETLKINDLATYADDVAAGVGGLTKGDVYITATGELRAKL